MAPVRVSILVLRPIPILESKIDIGTVPAVVPILLTPTSARVDVLSLAVVQILVLAIELIFAGRLAWEKKTCIGVGSGAGSCTSLGIGVTTGTSIGVGTDIGNYVGTRTRTTRTAIAVPGTQNAPRRNARSTVNPPRCSARSAGDGVLDGLTNLFSYR